MSIEQLDFVDGRHYNGDIRSSDDILLEHYRSGEFRFTVIDGTKQCESFVIGTHTDLTTIPKKILCQLSMRMLADASANHSEVKDHIDDEWRNR